MKSKLFLIIVVSAFMFSSCETIEDWFRTDIETTLEMSVNVNIPQPAMMLKSGEVAAENYSFSESGNLSLADNPEIEEHIDKLKALTLENLEVSIFGLQSGQVINSLTVSVSGIGTIVTLTNITPGSGTFTPAISETLLEQVANLLLDSHTISATVAGNSNYAPMSFNVELAFDALVEAGLL